MGILEQWWVTIVLGVIAGSITARYAPERLFKVVFVMVAWSAAARLLLARDNWKFGDDVPKGPLMRLYGFVVGLLSTLMGVGGGLFSNLLMTFYGRPIHQAVATSSALAVLISIPGALGYVYAGWPAAVAHAVTRSAAPRDTADAFAPTPRARELPDIRSSVFPWGPSKVAPILQEVPKTCPTRSKNAGRSAPQRRAPNGACSTAVP